MKRKSLDRPKPKQAGYSLKLFIPLITQLTDISRIDPCYALIKDHLTRWTVLIYYRNPYTKNILAMTKWSCTLADESSIQIMNVLMTPSIDSNQISYEIKNSGRCATTGLRISRGVVLRSKSYWIIYTTQRASFIAEAWKYGFVAEQPPYCSDLACLNPG